MTDVGLSIGHVATVPYLNKMGTRTGTHYISIERLRKYPALQLIKGFRWRNRLCELEYKKWVEDN